MGEADPLATPDFEEVITAEEGRRADRLADLILSVFLGVSCKDRTREQLAVLVGVDIPGGESRIEAGGHQWLGEHLQTGAANVVDLFVSKAGAMKRLQLLPPR